MVPKYETETGRLSVVASSCDPPGNVSGSSIEGMGKSFDRGEGLEAPGKNSTIEEVGGLGMVVCGVAMIGSVGKETIGICEVDAGVLGSFAT